MRILILSFYYAPDLSAGSFRTTTLVSALVDQLPPGATIDVVTTSPNRYGSFTVDMPALEQHGPVTIRRIALPAHQSGFVDQSRAFLAFARGALGLTRGEKYSLVFATSSRLMTAVLGSEIARRTRTPLYLDLRDIFADTIREVLPRTPALLLAPLFSLMERLAMTRARKVNLVSPGFAEYFRRRYPRQTLSFFTNGIDDEFIAFAGTARSPDGANRVRTVVYAGNIGDGQGLHEIVPTLAVAMRDRVRFRLIGDGGRRRALESRVAALGLTNVSILPPMSRDKLLEEYRDADVLFLHLNDYEAFKKVLPSKIFEYAATGKPIWAGVAGYAAEFLRDNVENSAVFAPCDADGAASAFARLDFASTPRTTFTERFSRRAINRAFATDILDVVRDG